MQKPELNFEWDPEKAASNLRKHGISFERAASIFKDPEALTVFDSEHSGGEERRLTVGLDNQGGLVLV